MGNEVKRMRYFDGLFLKEDEFNLEQNYHIRMRHLHNRRLHTWGIVWGLEVVPGPGSKEVTVKEGMALNKVSVGGEEVSQEIVLASNTPVDLAGYYPKEGVYISISRDKDKEVDVVEEKGGTKEIHWLEGAVIKHNKYKPTNESENIILAKVVIKDDNTIDDTSIYDMEGINPLRRYAGFAGKVLEAEKLTLAISGVTSGLASIEGKKIDALNGIQVNSPKTSFTGDLSVGGVLSGSLDPNNISGIIPESKIDAAIARDSELQAKFDPTLGHSHNGIDSRRIPSIDSTYFANLSGANLTNLNPNNISGIIPESKIDAAIARDSELQAKFDPTWGHGHNGTDSKKILPSDLSGVTANVTAPNLNFLTGGSTSDASSLHYHATIPKQIFKYHVPLKPIKQTGQDEFKIWWTSVTAELNKNVTGYIPLYLPHGAKLTKISVHTTTTVLLPSFYCYVEIWRASHEITDSYVTVGSITVTSSGEKQGTINHTVDNNIGYYLLRLYVPPRAFDVTIDGIYIEYELDRLF